MEQVTMLLWLAWLLASVSAGVLTAPLSKVNNDNSNHIFNAIHASMRQWGSSLQHNGMSFFIATVPEGTHFYHGNPKSEPVKGPEWLAFEPEHALLFARPRGPPPGGPGGPPGGPPGKSPRRPPPLAQHVLAASSPKPPNAEELGYLHTYSTKHQLRLLYLDGMSAAKSEKGTLDTQDYILAPMKDGEKRRGMGEDMRATKLCDRAKNTWKGRIDGFLRMEGGFEIILCNFQDNLQTLRIESTKGAQRDEEDFFNYYQSVTSRYDGIGGNRVHLDYDDFVTAYSFNNDSLFDFGDMPRLNGTDTTIIKAINSEVDRIANKTKKGKQQPSTSIVHDWQAIADMVVARHGARLAYLTSGVIDNKSELVLEMTRIMRPFINEAARDPTREIQRCTNEFIPAGWPKGQASQAIEGVSHQICSTFASISDQSEEQSLSSTMQQIKDLMDWLDWTGWKRCSGCHFDEICLVPIWPHGSKEDWIRPNCVKARGIRDHMGYWMDRDGPPLPP